MKATRQLRQTFALLALLSIAGCNVFGGYNNPNDPLGGNFHQSSTGSSPVISSISPTSGLIGTVVTVWGDGFSSNTANELVGFSNGGKVAPTTTSPTMLTFSVPAGSTSGPVVLSVNGGAFVSGPNFSVTTTSPPTGLATTPGNNQVLLTWSAVTGATSYKVFYAPGGSASTASTQIATGMISGTTATITGLNAAGGTVPLGPQYAFIVVATDPVGDSAPSAVATTNLIPYGIGNTGPGGGLVCYDSEVSTGTTFTETINGNLTTCRYLEAAPVDQSAGISWWNSSGTIAGAGGVLIGTGAANTTAIVSAQVGSWAAQACTSYSGGGKTDWFLPSSGELNVFYTNLVTHVPSLGGFTANYYWTSSQLSSINADCQDMTQGNTGNNNF